MKNTRILIIRDLWGILHVNALNGRKFEIIGIDGYFLGNAHSNRSIREKGISSFKRKCVRDLLARLSILRLHFDLIQNAGLGRIGQTLLINGQNDVLLFVDGYLKFGGGFHAARIFQIEKAKFDEVVLVEVVLA